MITTPFGADGHDADRPSWDCRACGAPFPCNPAREALRESFGPVPLAMFMWSALDAAISDLGTATLAGENLYNRFIKWTRPAPHPTAAELDQWRGYRTVVTVKRQAG